MLIPITNFGFNDKDIAEFKSYMMEETGITDEETFDDTYTTEDVAYYALNEKVVNFLLENATPVEATTEATTEAAQ